MESFQKGGELILKQVQVNNKKEELCEEKECIYLLTRFPRSDMLAETPTTYGRIDRRSAKETKYGQNDTKAAK